MVCSGASMNHHTAVSLSQNMSLHTCMNTFPMTTSSSSLNTVLKTTVTLSFLDSTYLRGTQPNEVVSTESEWGFVKNLISKWSRWVKSQIFQFINQGMPKETSMYDPQSRHNACMPPEEQEMKIPQSRWYNLSTW